MSDTAVLRIRVESSGISAASSDLQRLTAQGGATENSLLRLKNIVFAVGAAMGVDTVIRYSDAWTSVSNKLANATKEGETLADVQSRVFSIAQRSNSSLEATATLYGRLEPVTKKLVKSGEELGGITETINKAMIVSGATSAEAAGSLVQLAQGLGAGALRGDEFNSVNEAAPRLMKAMADSLGVTRGELKGLASQGKITSEVVINAMRSQSAAIDTEFSRMNATFEQKGVKAYNNMIRSIGENNDLASATSAAGDALLGLSQHVDTVVAAGEIMAAVYGAKLVGSLAASTQAKIATALASQSVAAGEVQAAEAAAAAASIDVRRAIAAKESAALSIASASAKLNSARASGIDSEAEVQLALAQEASVRVQLEQIASEKALEVQRLKSQISSQGLIATSTRMAEVRQAEVVLTQRLAEAEVATAAARSAALARESAMLAEVNALKAVARSESLAVTEAKNIETAATERLAAAQAAANTTTRAGAGALALIGGPAGAAMLAAGALYYFAQKTDESKTSMDGFAASAATTKEELGKLTYAQQQALQVKLNDALEKQKDGLVDLRREARLAKKDMSEFNDMTNEQKASSEEYQSANNALIIALANLEEGENKVSSTKSKLYAISQTLNGQIQENYASLQQESQEAGIAAGMQAELNKVLGIQVDTRKQLYVLTEKPSISTAAMKDIKAMQQQNELLKAQGVEKAKLEARQKGQEKGYTELDIQAMEREAAEGYNIEQSQKAAAKATQDKEAADRKAASAVQQLQAQVESNNDKVSESKLRTEQLTVEYNNLLNGTDSITGATSRYTIESARLAAQQQLTKNATKEQVNALADELLKQDQINEKIKKSRQVQKDTKDFKKTTEDFKADATVDKNNPLSSENAEHQKRMAQIIAFSQTEAAKMAEGKRLIGEAETAETKRNEAAVSAIREAGMLNSLSFIESSASGITSALSAAGKEQTGLYKAMFLAQKAAAIPSMMVATKEASTAAMAMFPGPAGLTMAGVIEALGYANIGMVAGTAIAGAFDDGGRIPAGAYGIVAEKSDELVNGTLIKGPANVISRKDTAKMLNNDNGSQTSVQNNFKINLIEDASRSGQVRQRSLTEQDVIDIYVSNIHQGGDIATAGEGIYGWSRIGRY